MKKIKRMLAILMVMVMAMGMTMTVSAAFDGINYANSTANVSVSKLQETTTSVTAYQILSASYDENTKQVTYQLTDWAKAALVGKTIEGVDIKAETQVNDVNAVNAVIKALGGRVGVKNGQTETADPASNSLLSTLANAVTESTPSVQTVTNIVNGTATFTDMAVGSYLVLATDSKIVYNPMQISVGLTADDNGKINGVQANNTDAKFSTVPFDKTMVVGDQSVQGDDKQVGDTVQYKLTGTIPNYDTNVYQNITYKITDKLSAGLDAPLAKDIQVKVGETIVSPKNDAAESYVTVNGQDITVDLSSIAAEHLGESVEVTYSATLNENATTGFDANENAAKLTYSNGPGENDTATTEEKKTYTYTFAIDGSVWANSELIGHELKKTGKNEWTRTETDKIASEYKALAGAEFTLYTNSECTDESKVADTNLKGTNPATSDAAGAVTFAGLDGNKDYFLKETKAPAGYSINDQVYKVKFVPQYAADGKMSTYEVWINDQKVVTYTYTGESKNESGETIPANVGAVYTTKTATVNGESVEIETTEIRNTQLSALPSTGGIGTYIFTLAGIVIMAAAAALFFMSRRKAR